MLETRRDAWLKKSQAAKTNRKAKKESIQYKLIYRTAPRAGSRQPRPTNGILLAMMVMN